MPDLIGPDGLEPDAVLPQCLDNQYVSDAIFADMCSRGVDYQDPAVASARELDFRNEFIRSIVYSSQVVIQRAFLKNSDFLYKNYLPADKKNFDAFAALMRQHAIVPYLWAESSLSEDLAFNLREEGDRALQELLREVGDDVRCVRLAVGEKDNLDATKALATAFGTGLIRLQLLDSEQRNEMASELFADPAVLQADGMWQAFESALDGLADYAYAKPRELRLENKTFTRQFVYRDLFAAGADDKTRGENVALGRFRPAGPDDPFLLELKKYVDLVYNTNLPDHLRRYTFTPANMPSRMALRDMPVSSLGHDQIGSVIGNRDGLEWIRRTFTAAAESAMDLPLLRDLTVSDVLAIRALPEWEAFKTAQAGILVDPLHCLDNMPAFQQSFDQFQRALSDWYYDTHQREASVKRYSNFVSLALCIGGIVVVAGSHLGPIPHDLGAAGVPPAVAKLPNKITSYAAKLLVGVYDHQRERLDSDRAYTIELMRTNQELSRSDILDLIAGITGGQDGALPGARGLVADHGIQ